MQKLKKNLTVIEHKFQSLKSTHQTYEQPTPIGEVAEIMTHGVIRQQQVQNYLQYVHSDDKIIQQQKINQNWYELNIQEMILFLDKVIKYRNINKPKQLNKKTEILIHPNLLKKKKTKRKNNQQHQNPYIPPSVDAENTLENQYNQTDNILELIQSNQQQTLSSNNVQKQIDQQKSSHQLNNNNQQQNQDHSSTQSQQMYLNSQILNIHQNNPQSNINSQSTSTYNQISLSPDFQQLTVSEKYLTLSEKYHEIKKSLQRKFMSIYEHYRKEMYIPFQSFQKNHELMMDLRIFLKYFREFQIAKKYRASTASQYFKKTATNGIWLNYQKFIEIHYKLIQLYEINQLLNQQVNKNSINKIPKKLKQQLIENIKVLIQNLSKINILSQLINDQKINKILNYNNKNFIKKIVQIHSGLIKEDVMLKLNQRNEQRKRKNANLLNCKLINKLGLQENSIQYLSSSLHKKNIPGQTSQSSAISPSSKVYQLSVYKQIDLPKLHTRQLKKSSIYSSLQLLNMYKQKQKLKKLVNEEQHQKYLQQYFKKQKIIESKMKRNHSLYSSSTQNMKMEGTLSPIITKRTLITNKNYSSVTGLPSRNSLSLPRMRFT